MNKKIVFGIFLILLFGFSSKSQNNSSAKVPVNNLFDKKYESNAWVYRYYESGQYNKMDGYFPQAGLNLMAGITLKF